MMKNINRFLDKIFLLKILLPTFLALGLFVMSIFQIIIPKFEEIILDRKREMIRELTNSVWHIAKLNNQQAEAGSISQKEAQRRTIEQVRSLRYGEEQKDYFWITDTQPKMIVHPYREDLNDKDLSDFKDSHGKKLFVEMANVVKSDDGGFVDYTWQWKDDSTRIVPKLSYVKYFKPWGWIIGTGIYIEDVKYEIANLEQNVINIAIWITIAISLILFFIVIQNYKSESKRVLAENELKESREKYKALVEATTEGLLMVLEGKQIYYNKTLLAMLGYNEEETSSLQLNEIFANINKNDALEFDNPEHLRAALSKNIETWLKRKDGSLIDVLLMASPISFFGQNGVIVIVKDISHHKQITAALDESKEKYLTLTNQLQLAVFRTEAEKEMKIIEGNPEALSFFNCANEHEIQAINFGDLFDEQIAFKTITKELLEKGFVKNKIAALRRKNNTLAVVSLSMVLIKDSEGRTRYCDVIIEDITDKKINEENKGSIISALETPRLFLNHSIEQYIENAAVCMMGETVEKGAKTISKTGAKVVFIKDKDENYIGMAFKEDISGSIIKNLSANQPIYEIMRAPIISVHDSSLVYDVLSLYYEKGQKYFGVKNEANEIYGLIDIDEIQKSHLHTYFLFIKNIENAETIEEIKQYHRKLMLYIRMLIESGANVRNICFSTATISETITKKIISLAIDELGPPPVKFSFLTFGSEGRAEQTLVTDQDNAILYEDVEDTQSEKTREYFLKLSELVCDLLNDVGYTFCKGNIMAKNPKWLQPLSVWKQYFMEWVNTANPQDLLDVNIFFDLKLAYGDEKLYEVLQKYLFKILTGNNAFFVYLTQNALRIKPPFGNLKTAEYIDSKLALLPLIDLVRIYSLSNNIKSLNTIERLVELHEKGVFSASGYQDILYAFTFLMQLRYRQQSKMLAENNLPNNNIYLAGLTEIDKLILKRVLSQIEDFQAKLSLDFKGIIQ